jgi:hypothetical protein
MIGATNQAEFFAVATETFFSGHTSCAGKPRARCRAPPLRPAGSGRAGAAARAGPGTAGRELGTQAGILAATLRLQPDRPSGLVLPI